VKEKAPNGTKRVVGQESKEVLLKLDQLKNEIKNTLLLEDAFDGRLLMTKKSSKVSSTK
jgi:hypothetical protein